MEQFCSASRSRVFATLTRLFAFLSALRQGGCVGHRPKASRSPLPPAPSHGCLVVLERDGRTHVSKSCFRSVAPAAACAPLCTAQECTAPWHGRRMLGAAAALRPGFSVLSLGHHCWRAHGGGVPCPPGKGWEGFSNFRWQMMLDFLMWKTPAPGRAPRQQLLAAPPPPLPFQSHR